MKKPLFTIERIGCPADRNAQKEVCEKLDLLPGDATSNQRWFLAGLLAQEESESRESVLGSLKGLTKAQASVLIDNLKGGKVAH